MAENLQLSPDPAWMNTEGVTYNDPLMFDRSIVPGKTALYPTYRKKKMVHFNNMVLLMLRD